MGRTACTEPQCLYKGALYLLPLLPLWVCMACSRTNFTLVIKLSILLHVAVVLSFLLNCRVKSANLLVRLPMSYSLYGDMKWRSCRHCCVNKYCVYISYTCTSSVPFEFVSQTSFRKRIFCAGQHDLLGAVHVLKGNPIYTFKSQFTLHDKY
jgi:hypothetical protein